MFCKLTHDLTTITVSLLVFGTYLVFCYLEYFLVFFSTTLNTTKSMDSCLKSLQDSAQLIRGAHGELVCRGCPSSGVLGPVHYTTNWDPKTLTSSGFAICIHSFVSCYWILEEQSCESVTLALKADPIYKQNSPNMNWEDSREPRYTTDSKLNIWNTTDAARHFYRGKSIFPLV